MRKSLLAMVAFAPLTFAQTQTYTYTYDGLPLPVYPDDWDTAAVASILVPRSILVANVTASVQVQFNGVGNLNVFLWSAEGTRSKLLERNCGGLQNVDTTFDDSASSRYSDFCPSEAGRGPFRGNEPLANSRNQNAFGYWKLAVENNGSEGTGYLTGFSITITGTPLGPPVMGPNTIVSTASFVRGSVAPGEQLAIFGANLGPAGGVRAGAGANLPTTLGPTSVSFDGVTVPLYFAGDRLVAAQAPTNLSPGATTSIQVISASGSSNVVRLPVVPAKPGVFTYEAGGSGQAKAINQDGTMNGDGSINGSDRPAAPGSIIQIFAAGLGPVDPPIPQGAVAPTSPLSVATLPISATIGGRAAVVTHAGAAPGQVGMYQVNIMVPALAPSGANGLVVVAGGNPSQSGVSIQVR
jgi:uncharacterized protein (TIGR03437 family)